MKPDDFEKDLRDLAGGFNLPVQNDLFHQVMSARKDKRRKRGLAFFLCGLVTALTLLFTFMYEKQKGHDEALKPHVARTKTYNHNQKLVAAGNKQPLEETTPKITNNSSTYKESNIKEEKRHFRKQTGSKEPSVKIPNHKTVNASGKVISPAGQPLLALAIAKQTHHEPEIKPGTSEITSVKKEALTTTQSIDSGVTRIPSIDSALVIAPVDSVSPLLIPALSEQPKIKAETARHIETGMYANYFAVSNAINASSLIPLNKPDSFGLNEKANHAFAMGIKGSYPIGSNWKLTLGLGLNNLQFDQIRIAEIKVDSFTAQQITNNVKSVKAFNQNISEQSFTWLEIPAGISYSIPLSNKISFCTEAGLVYHVLLQSKAYEFTSSSDGDLSYKEMNNIGHERLNKNIFSFYLQPGVSTALTKRINLFTGLSYRRQFNSYYKEEYFSTGSFYFLGLAANVSYKF